jgi:hypothetical protein
MPDDDLLVRLTEVVGNYFADEPQCVAAAAVLVELGREFGFELNPRPVSMYAASRSGDGSIATGDKAGAFGARLALNQPIDTEYRWHTDFDRAGHMVVTADDGNWLLDASFSQFTYAGLPRTIITTPVEDVHPRLGFTQIADSDMQIRYWFEDEVGGWRDQYDDYLSLNRGLIEALARLIREGTV